MRIAVFSDSHGDVSPMESVLSGGGFDLVIHLGDYVRDAASLQKKFPRIPFRVVRGNGDMGAVMTPLKDVFMLEGVRVYMTHGHELAVKQGLEPLIFRAKTANARLVLFGHTHRALLQENETLTILNPGPVCNRGVPGWAELTVSGSEFTCELRYF